MPLVFHGICDDSCTGANSVRVATFTAFLDWLQQRSGAGTTDPGATVFAVSWKVRRAALGQHPLRAVATDVAGSSTSSTAVAVTIVKYAPLLGHLRTNGEEIPPVRTIEADGTQ